MFTVDVKQRYNNNLRDRKKIKFTFFLVNTKIFLLVLKISEISLVIRTSEITDIFITVDEIFLEFTKRSKYPLYIEPSEE